MLDNHEALNGVSTKAYVGRQRQRRNWKPPCKKRPVSSPACTSGIIGSSVPWLLTTLCCSRGPANLWQGRTGVKQVPYVVLMDHLGNQMPLAQARDLPVTRSRASLWAR